jgi:hypothetical protein
LPESRTATTDAPVVDENVKAMFAQSTSTDVVPSEPRIFQQDYVPVWRRLSEDQQKLLRTKSGAHITDAELAQGCELAASYGLDPFANEIWFTKSKPKQNGQPGRLLIMVGRDGLRKKVQQNGLEMPCSVVYEKDDFSVAYVTSPEMLAVALASHGAPMPDDLTRAFVALGGGHPFHFVWHVKRGIGEARGNVVGAWARTYERKTSIERGYFDAPIEEYEPTGDYDSPWKKQKSVMMLGAVERQAARQGTPLGGLLVEGEDEVINATAVELPPAPDVDLSPEVEAIVERARNLGHQRHANRPMIAAMLGGQSEEHIARWCQETTADLDRLAAEGKAEVAKLNAQQDAPAISPDDPLADAEPVDEADPRVQIEMLTEEKAAASAIGDEATAEALQRKIEELREMGQDE